MNPAARRDCESETAFENGTNSSGISISARITTVPPSTSAPHGLRAASTATGTRTSAAIAIAPVLPGTSAASRKWCTDVTTSSPP